MARAFVRVHKPRSPVMIAYGEAFPEFADAYLASADVPPRIAMAADVARLENAWVEAYHAEDAGVATVADLAALGVEALPRTRVAFHPAARFLRFSTPAASVWAAPIRTAPIRRPRSPASRKTRSSPVPTATSGCASSRRCL